MELDHLTSRELHESHPDPWTHMDTSRTWSVHPRRTPHVHVPPEGSRVVWSYMGGPRSLVVMLGPRTVPGGSTPEGRRVGVGRVGDGRVGRVGTGRVSPGGSVPGGLGGSVPGGSVTGGSVVTVDAVVPQG